MIKNMIIAILLARVSMVYIFTEYSPLEEATVALLRAYRVRAMLQRIGRENETGGTGR